MKRTPGILLILIPFSVISIRAQTPGQSLKLDFGSREFDDASLKQLNKINEGDFYKIVIENINTYLYRIELTVNDVIINPDVKIPTFDDFALESLTSLISGLPGLSIDPIELIDVSKNESLLETFAKDNKIEKSGSIESRLQKEEDQIKAYLEEITVIQKQINGWRHKAQLHDYTTTKSFDVGRFIAERPDTTLLKNLHKSIVDDQKKYLEEIQKFSELSQEKYKQRHMLILDTYNKVLIPSIQTSLTALGDKALINILISLAQRRIDVERRLNLSSSLLDLSPITEAIRDWWMSVYKYTGLLKLDEPQTDVRNLTVKEMHTDIIRKPTAILSDISLKRNTMITQRTNYQNEISSGSSCTRSSRSG